MSSSENRGRRTFEKATHQLEKGSTEMLLLLSLACKEPEVNQPPAVDEILITPEAAYNDSVLTCTARVSDPEDDEDEYYKSLLVPAYQWMLGEEILNTKEKIRLENFDTRPQDVLTCMVSITDYRGLSTTRGADVILGNRAPVIERIVIGPTEPYNDSTLVCEVDVFDPDEEVSLQYSWTSGAMPLGDTASIDITDADLRAGDEVSCSVQAEDAYGETTAASTSIILQNRAPAVPSATISWTLGGVLYPDADSEIICSTELVEDPDGDQLTYSAIWTNQDGQQVVGSRLFPSSTESRDVWTCEMVVTDQDLASSSTASIMIRDFDWESCSSAQDLDGASHHFIGENPEDAAGSWVASAGDVDGDGLGDILVGAPNNDDVAVDAGKIYLIFGASLAADTLSLSEADFTFVGENMEDFAGLAVASAGDVDGDGLDDILISSRVNDDGGNDAGKTYLIFASSLDPLNPVINLASADYKFVGVTAYDVSGWSISTAGDVDGDGLDDLLISAIRARDWVDTDVGKTYLILGSSLGNISTIDLSYADFVFIGEDVDDWSGSSIASAGDVDGDGLGDILIGADGNDHGGDWSGKAYLVLGSSIDWSAGEMSLGDADYAFIGDEFDRAGSSVASAGDVDGDSLADFLIGADGDYDGGFHAGKTYLVLGASLGPPSMNLPDVDYQFVGDETDLAGSSVASAGDVDEDGLDDLLIGAPGNNEGGYAAGKTYLMLGSSLGNIDVIDLSDADHGLIGAEPTGLTGSSVSGAGDVNGDGINDVLIGVPNDAEGGYFAGKVSVFTGCY